MTSENVTEPRDYAGLNRAVFARVNALRKSRGWSMQRLAGEVTRIGRPITRTSLNDLSTRPEARCPADLLFALADVFGIAVDEFLDPICDTCKGQPPAGFACNSCGRVA